MFLDENYTKDNTILGVKIENNFFFGGGGDLLIHIVLTACSNERGGGVDIEIKLAMPDRCMLHILHDQSCTFYKLKTNLYYSCR